MRLGLVLGATGARYSIDMDLILEAESLGFDSVWFSEAWGNDALTPAAWVLSRTSRIKVGTAIIQMQARTPAMAAMTALTLQSLSDNRFVLGIGPSGPQVIEGWHGVPFGRPLERTREYIAIIRQIIDRAAPLEHHGHHYQIPYRGEGSSGLAKPLKSILHGDPSLKIYTGAIAPGGVRTAAEVADGFFPFLMVPERFDLFQESLDEGFALAGGGKGLQDFDVAPFVRVSIGDDLEACRAPIKQTLALYIGGMGARAKNFYNDFAKRLGYADAAAEIQDLFLDGKREAAAARVPDKLADDVALIGPQIPPSMLMIVYSMLTQQSLVKLLLAGFIPGIISAVFYMVMIHVLGRIRPDLGPVGPRFSWAERGKSLVGIGGIAIVIMFVVGGMYSGVFTASEAAATGAMLTLAMALMRKGITRDRLGQALSMAGVTTSAVFMIVLGTLFFSKFLSLSGLPAAVVNFASGLNVPPLVILSAIIVIYLFLGMFLEVVSMMAVTLPTVLPIVMALGYDPIWFGIIVIKMSEIAAITPPMGLNVYSVKGVAGDSVALEDIFKNILPFLLMDLLTVVLFVAFPQIVLWLPSMML